MNSWLLIASKNWIYFHLLLFFNITQPIIFSLIPFGNFFFVPLSPAYYFKLLKIYTNRKENCTRY